MKGVFGFLELVFGSSLFCVLLVDMLAFEDLIRGRRCVLEPFEKLVAEAESRAGRKRTPSTFGYEVKLPGPQCIAGEMQGSLERRKALMWSLEPIHSVAHSLSEASSHTHTLCQFKKHVGLESISRFPSTSVLI
jgi:hypothetical protein